MAERARSRLPEGLAVGPLRRLPYGRCELRCDVAPALRGDAVVRPPSGFSRIAKQYPLRMWPRLSGRHHGDVPEIRGILEEVST